MLMSGCMEVSDASSEKNIRFEERVRRARRTTVDSEMCACAHVARRAGMEAFAAISLICWVDEAADVEVDIMLLSHYAPTELAMQSMPTHSP